MSPIGATPPSTTSANSGLFFPPSQPTPDHIMLAARKQQLAHLQNLQRQQQQMLQQMTPRSHSMVPMPSGYEERNDRFTSGGLRSPAMSSFKSTGTSQQSARFSAMPPTSQPVFECDYDTNPTELYLAVQKKDWEAAATIAAEFPHEASTWVSRKESDGKLRWRLLPLHAAIIFKAPAKAVGALLCAFAHGAACKDDQGMLPLHLAFRNGCSEEVVSLLLIAYPQSVDVQDRKGRTPMVLAQGSNHPNRDAYIRALERGPAYYAVANVANYGVPESVNPNSGVVIMSEEERSNIEALRNKIDQLTAEHTARVNELEGELNKTQETSQVLVDHVNSLEAQLASRSDTERFLATKIANLDSQLKSTTKTLEEKEAEFATLLAENEEKSAALLARVEAAEAEAAEFKLALEDKREAAKKVYAMTNKERLSYEERMEKCEREANAHRSNAQMLEEQLKKKIETEHALASQVSMLAAQLAASASNTTEATASYQRKCEALEEENQILKDHVAKLEKKLSTVASALDAMATEQERIVAAATRHEQTMADAAAAHLRIMNDTARQESLLEDAAKEREQIVAILMRQAEDAERTMTDRERILEAVREQEEGMMAAAEERDLLVASVNKQREYMDFVMNGELKFLKMTQSEEEQEDEIESRRMEMEAKKDEYFSTVPKEDGNEDVEGEENFEEESSNANLPSQREAELRAQIAIEEAMLAKLKADEAASAEGEKTEEVVAEKESEEQVAEDVVLVEETSVPVTDEVASDEQQMDEEVTEEKTAEDVAAVEDSEEQDAAAIEETEEVAADSEHRCGEVCATESIEQPSKKASVDPEESAAPEDIVPSNSAEEWIPLEETTVDEQESAEFVGDVSRVDTGDAQSVSSRKTLDPPTA
ncbi:hypothetical protein ACHAWX_004143 [Stephanocyclus meneghinianus]